VAELRHTLQRDLLRCIRQLKAAAPSRRVTKIEEASKVTELLINHRKNKITPTEYRRFREELFGGKNRTGAGTMDPNRTG
jgi:hypothetical protein